MTRCVSSFLIFKYDSNNEMNIKFWQNICLKEKEAVAFLLLKAKKKDGILKGKIHTSNGFI